MQRLDPVLVGVGGFVGAILRYAVGVAVPGVPGTVVANVVGSFALGVLVASVGTHRSRMLLGTGLLSSFTTYSTFAVETAGLAPAWGVANVGVTYAAGIASAVAGLAWGARR